MYNVSAITTYNYMSLSIHMLQNMQSKETVKCTKTAIWSTRWRYRKKSPSPVRHNEDIMDDKIGTRVASYGGEKISRKRSPVGYNVDGLLLNIYEDMIIW